MTARITTPAPRPPLLHHLRRPIEHRLRDLRGIISRQLEPHKPKVVVQHLRVPHAGIAPVGVDHFFELGVGGGDLCADLVD